MQAPNWGEFCGSLFLCGALSGTLLDGIHSHEALQVYDLLPLELGPLKTSALVPPLLGVFYVVLGALHPLTDNLARGDERTRRAQLRASDTNTLALSAGALAVMLQVSASLYARGTPYPQIGAILALLSALNWRVFDNTRQGLALAALCAAGAPLSELLLISLTHCWHYSRPDVLGFVSWVPCCYFFYTPWLGNLGRFLWQNARDVTPPPPSPPPPPTPAPSPPPSPPPTLPPPSSSALP